MAKAHPCAETAGGPTTGYMIMCPACGNGHLFNIVPGPNGVGGSKPCWTFDGNVDAPTFSPSMLVRGTKHLTGEEIDRMMAGEKIEPIPVVCHSFVRGGSIEFLADCSHELAGQTVPLEDW
jgi:hypothetical protein